jgi:putative transposase
LQRTVAGRQRGGSNRRKAVLQLQRQQEDVANRRRDFLKKTAHDLVRPDDRMALEDVPVSNMVRNPHWSQSILDAGWGYLKVHLPHTAEEAGRVVVRVNPAYTSKACSQGGTIFENLTRADRWVQCAYGASLDRDVNAAQNILGRGQRLWAVT